jgi:hypothetical protein
MWDPVWNYWNETSKRHHLSKQYIIMREECVGGTRHHATSSQEAWNKSMRVVCE